MSIKVEKITDPLVLGEGPHWDERSQTLFFVSINEKTIHKYVLETKEHTKTTLDGKVGFILPVDGTSDQFVVGVNRKFLVIRWDGKEGSAVSVVKELGEVDQHEPTNRINDGKADPRGRVFAGTMSSEPAPGQFARDQGALFRIDSAKGAKVETVCDKVSLSNGLAWDVKEKAFYYIDSLEFNIQRYDYDVETGDICNGKEIFNLKKNGIEGFPDGMTVDADGNIWMAVFGGSAIYKIDPRAGKILQKVPIPSLQVTSVAFGGPNLDILFVTTANVHGEQSPPDGSTFMVTGLGVKGYASVNAKI